MLILVLMFPPSVLVAIPLDKNNIFDLPLNQYISTYSTGMCKKLALLAVLLQDISTNNNQQT